MICRNSGLSIRQWCKENSINEKTYYYWKRRAFQAVTQENPCFAEVPVSAPKGNIDATIHLGVRAVEIYSGADKSTIAYSYTDLRRGIDGLASMVQQQFRLNPFSNTLFLFCIRRCDHIKELYWEGNAFVFMHKRLESGRRRIFKKCRYTTARNPRNSRIACQTCKKNDIGVPIKTAQAPKSVISSSFASAEAITHLMTQNFVIGSPLYRQEQDWNRQTMSTWILKATKDWLVPVCEELHRRLCRQKVLHADETTLQGTP